MKIVAILFTVASAYAAVQASSVHMRVHAKAADAVSVAGPFEACSDDVECDEGLMCVIEEEVANTKRKQAAATIGQCVPVEEFGSESYSGSEDYEFEVEEEVVVEDEEEEEEGPSALATEKNNSTSSTTIKPASTTAAPSATPAPATTTKTKKAHKKSPQKSHKKNHLKSHKKQQVAV